MVEGLNILLDAAAELGKPVEIHAVADCVMIDGMTKAGERFFLRLMIREDSNERNDS